MKHHILLIVAVLVVFSGCETRQVVVRAPAPPAPVVVMQEPPPPVVETIGRPPGPDVVWVPGYYEWTGHRYVWHRGSWARLPHSGATYVEGHWERHHNGWTFVPGSWR